MRKSSSRNNRNEIRNQDYKKLLIDAVSNYIEIEYKKNIIVYTQAASVNADKLKTIIIRDLLGKKIELTNNKDKNIKIIKQNITHDYLIKLINEYINRKTKKEKNSPEIIVYVKHFIDYINAILSENIKDEEIEITKYYKVQCSCGALASLYFKQPKLMEAQTGTVIENTNGQMHLADAEGNYPYRYSYMYKCPKCHNVCFAHPGTLIPYGVPADIKTRTLRNLAHKKINQMNLSHEELKTLYKSMAQYLNIEVNEMHIGLLSREDVEKVISYLETA